MNIRPVLSAALWYVLCLLSFSALLGGCMQSTRSYLYTTIQHPDGRIEKRVEATIINSDVKMGQFEAEALDGTTLKINDLDAQERSSVTNAAAWEVMGRAVEKIPSIPPVPR